MKKWLKRILLVLVLIVLGYTVLYWTNDIPLEVLKMKYANMESEFMELDGMQVHYRDEGSGPVLVLVHGTASSLHTWDGWAKHLKSDFRVIRVDIPAFGLTGPNATDDYSMQAYVDFINKFTAKLEVYSFLMAGNSLGGEIVWNYALTHPEKVQKMVLIDAAGYPKEGPIPIAFKLPRIPVINQLMTKVTPKRLVKRSLIQVMYNDELVTEDLVNRHYELLLRKGNRKAYVERVKQIWKRGAKSHERIKEIKTPTLIQWGREDVWLPLDHGEQFSKDLENSKMLVYTQAGHIPQEEIPIKSANDAKMFFLN